MELVWNVLLLTCNGMVVICEGDRHLDPEPWERGVDVSVRQPEP